jgi:hypothetical protein
MGLQAYDAHRRERERERERERGFRVFQCLYKGERLKRRKVNLGWLLRLLNGIRRFSHLHDIVPGGLVIIPPNTFFVSFVATTKMQSSGTISFRNERKKKRLTAARKKHRK